MELIALAVGSALRAAPKHPEMPCWQARFDAQIHIPEDCVNCDFCQRYPLL